MVMQCSVHKFMLSCPFLWWGISNCSCVCFSSESGHSRENQNFWSMFGPCHLFENFTSDDYLSSVMGTCTKSSDSSLWKFDNLIS